MTERDVNELLRARGVPEFMPSAGLAERIDVRVTVVKNALITGELKRVKRGTVARADLAIWMIRRPDVLAQLLNVKPGEGGTVCNGLRLTAAALETRGMCLTVNG